MLGSSEHLPSQSIIAMLLISININKSCSFTEQNSVSTKNQQHGAFLLYLISSLPWGHPQASTLLCSISYQFLTHPIFNSIEIESLLCPEHCARNYGYKDERMMNEALADRISLPTTSTHICWIPKALSRSKITETWSCLCPGGSFMMGSEIKT